MWVGPVGILSEFVLAETFKTFAKINTVLDSKSNPLFSIKLKKKYLKFFPHLMPTTSFNRPSNGLVATFSHPLHLSPQGVQLIGTKGDAAQL